MAKAVSGLPYFHGQGFLTKAARAVEDTFVGQAFIFNDEEVQRVLQPPIAVKRPSGMSPPPTTPR